MDNSFFFALARISAAQILRAAGFDRAKPSTLDTLTDILIRHLHLLGTQSMAFALCANRAECSIRDVRLAMEELGLISRGRLVSKKRIRRILREQQGIHSDIDENDSDPDGEDESDQSTESLERLLNWFKGPQALECRRVAGVSSTLVNGAVLPGESSQRPTFVAEYVTNLIQRELGKASGLENGTSGPETVQDGENTST